MCLENEMQVAAMNNRNGVWNCNADKARQFASEALSVEGAKNNTEILSPTRQLTLHCCNIDMAALHVHRCDEWPALGSSFSMK